MNSTTSKPRLALTGDTALELIAPYFREAGYEVMPADVSPAAFRPDFVCDVTAYDGVLAQEVPGFFDGRLERLAGCRYSLAGIRAIVDEFGWQRLAAPKKVLAVDADNTLWRGIISEDGVDGVEPYAAFQRGLKDLAAAGVVLVLLTKNDDDLVRRAPVDLSDFAAVRANWAPKPGNLLAALATLNLAADSAVFVDDSPHERAQMAAHLPEVAVAPFPEDLARPAVFLRRLKTHFFSGCGRTAEDALRARDYRANRLRATWSGYLDDLGLRVRPAHAAEADLDRLVQMAGKTNQFNATTLRRTRADFAALLRDPKRRVWTFRAGDRFGEQGLVCYVVADLAARRITDFVMSCRAMGRTLEHFALAYVTRELGYRPAIDFAPTARNAPFAAFLKEAGGSLKTHFRQC